MLPTPPLTPPPEAPGVQVATVHRGTTTHPEARCDWFDVIALGGLCTAFVVGRVVDPGRVGDARTVATRLRDATREATRATAPEALDAAIAGVVDDDADGRPTVTVSCCVFDPLDRSIRLASTGRCPALVVRRDGQCEWLEAAASVGTPGRSPSPTMRVDVDQPTRLVLFTDGLVRRAGRGRDPADDGYGQLCAVAARTRTRSVDEAADAVLAAFAPSGARADEIVVVVADLAPVPAPLHAVLAARFDAVPRFRAELQEWLMQSLVPSAIVDDVLIATNEAIANAIEHGSPDEQATVRVRAERVDGRVRIDIADAGRTVVAHPDPDRGRGMAMMRAVMDVVELDPSPTGTTVRMERALP